MYGLGVCKELEFTSVHAEASIRNRVGHGVVVKSSRWDQADMAVMLQWIFLKQIQRGT